MKNSPRFTAAAIFLFLAAPVEAEPLNAIQPRPNIILLMGDDHGWEETGYNNHPYVQTPCLDEMAKAGLRLDNFYAQPSCSPTRGNVLTGRHPNRYGIFRPGYSLRPEETTIAQLLRDAGYATAHFGKWHVGPVKMSSPTNPGAAGFDEWLSHDNFFELDPVFSRNGGPPKQFFGESSEILVDEAIRYLARKKKPDEPFFTVIWFGSPHEPYSGLEEDLALYRNLPERYRGVKVTLTSNETGKPVKRPLRDVLIERYAEITAMDRSIGKLRDALETLGLRENTFLWYCGDNGIPPSGLRESRFRGVKGKVYENGIRVPGVIEWPKGIPEPRVSTVNAVTSDILPTLCALAAAKTPDVPLDGVDLTPLLSGTMKRRGEPIEFWNFPVDRAAEESAKPYIDPELQKGTTPLVKESGGLHTRNFRNYHHAKISENDFKGERAILTDDYKLVIDGGKSTGIELFDLKKDVGETKNLAESNPDVVRQLSRQLRLWQEGVMNSLVGADYPQPAALDSADSTVAAPPTGLSGREINRFRRNAAARRASVFEEASGQPFLPRKIHKDWNNRGDFTRYYVQDVIRFATRSLLHNEQVDEANLALREMCRYHLDRPQTLLEIHSFPAAVRQLARLSLLYGPDGVCGNGLITKETHRLILETLWAWCWEKSRLSDAEVEPWHTWTAHTSENHDAFHFTSCWAATLLLSRERGYCDRKLADDHTPTDHQIAWTAWVSEYLRQRGRKGMTVEIDSPSYSAATLGAITFIYDLAEEPELRRLASHYLTLAWALWAEQQMNGVNGGAKTRCYPDRAKAAANPLSAAAWYVLGTDNHPKPTRRPAVEFLTSTWKIPSVVLNIASNVSGRGTYEIIQRRPGLRPVGGESSEKIHIASDTPALVRYTYATPDFMMGSLFCDALPYKAWNATSSQNRWHGVIFAGDPRSRIYPYCETERSSYNAHWAVQKRGTFIAQKLKTSRHAGQHRVWFSRAGLSAPIQDGSWYCVEAGSAYAAVRVVSGDATFEPETTNDSGRVLTCANELSPVILEVARKNDFPNFKAFRDAVRELPLQFDGTILTYTGLSQDRFRFFADQSDRPQINGTRIDLGPNKVYDSPFVRSDWDSGVVTIEFANEKCVLDFNE